MPTTTNVVPLRSIFDPSFSEFRAAYEPETSASRPPAGERNRPFVTCDFVTRPCVGWVWSTPPIVYADVWMFVCGGFRTWRSVCCGVVNDVRNLRRLAGRHF